MATISRLLKIIGLFCQRALAIQYRFNTPNPTHKTTNSPIQHLFNTPNPLPTYIQHTTHYIHPCNTHSTHGIHCHHTEYTHPTPIQHTPTTPNRLPTDNILSPQPIHIIQHTIHIIQHTSHIIQHTSHIIQHTIHIIQHTIHIIQHTIHIIQHTTHIIQNTTQGGEDPSDALSCRSFSTKEPLIIGLFCRKWPIKIRHPMGLRHPVLSALYLFSIAKLCAHLKL